MKDQIDYEGKWLRLARKSFTDSAGKVKNWEYARRKDAAGAVCVIATTPGNAPKLILVRQFRPPVGSDVIEFPAGLIDAGEDAAATALRELEEETGYTGKITRIGPPVCSSPGLTDEQVTWVQVEITGNKGQRLQAGESIEVLRLSPDNLRAELEILLGQGVLADAKVWSFAEGLTCLHAAT